MKGFEPEVINTLNDEELNLLISTLEQEKSRRAGLKREKLINAFKKAWYDLKEADIEVSFVDKDYFERYYINCFEDIEFD